MDNSENFEKFDIGKRERYHIARNAAIREFIFHHDVCRSERQCWEWAGYRNPKGYGVIIFDGFKFSVHRLSFEHYKGKISPGMLVMHDCDNPPCYNPNHLFLGTHTDNMQDMVRKGRHAAQRGVSLEVQDEPRILKRIQSERERVSWAWRHPA